MHSLANHDDGESRPPTAGIDRYPRLSLTGNEANVGGLAALGRRSHSEREESPMPVLEILQ